MWVSGLGLQVLAFGFTVQGFRIVVMYRAVYVCTQLHERTHDSYQYLRGLLLAASGSPSSTLRAASPINQAPGPKRTEHATHVSGSEHAEMVAVPSGSFLFRVKSSQA